MSGCREHGDSRQDRFPAFRRLPLPLDGQADEVERQFIFILAILVSALVTSRPCRATEPSFGIASWYSESDPGINPTTASGERFDDSRLTCATWDFPFGTYLRVTHLENGRTIVCRVNDRGPAKRLNRLIDLTKAAFQELAPLGAGLINVKVQAIEPTYTTRFPPEEVPLTSRMPAVTNALEFSLPHKNQRSSLPQSLTPPRTPEH